MRHLTLRDAMTWHVVIHIAGSTAYMQEMRTSRSMKIHVLFHCRVNS